MIAALLLAATMAPGQAVGAQTASEPTIMIVEFPRGARFIGFPRRCPGSTEEVLPEDELCLAELYEGWARVVRHLSGPRVTGRQRLRLTGHARRWGSGTRMLVLTWPFDDRGTRGNFAAWWDEPAQGDDYCMPVEDMNRAGDNAITRLFSQGYARRFQPFGYLRTDFRCIRGYIPRAGEL
jgi:hypothetical protein